MCLDRLVRLWPAVEPCSGSHPGRCTQRPARTWTSFQQQPRESLPRASAHPQPHPPSLLTRGCFSSQDLIKVHHSFLRAIDVSMMAGGSSLAKVFLDFKER